MSQGQVLVTADNLGQGATNSIERKLLFIGKAPENQLKVLSLNGQSDLDALLGEAESALKTQLRAAMLNADGLFEAYALPLDDITTQLMAVDTAMVQGIQVEGIVLCEPLADKAAVEAVFTKQQEVENAYHRFHFFLGCVAGIQADTQTWSDYTAATAAITDGVAAYTVGVVPLLHGNDLGALAGRLCKHAVTVADSPMRTATGTMVGLGAAPVDMDSVPLPSAVTAALDDARVSCTQTYPDYDGVYFGDLNLLDAEGGDYPVIENLRVVNKARRAVRIKAIKLIADRKLNSTPSSMAWAKRYLGEPLRQMAKRTVVAGVPFPGEIKPPQDDAITIVWQSKTQVRIYMRLTPYNAPKQIVISIGLDLADGTVE